MCSFSRTARQLAHTITFFASTPSSCVIGAGAGERSGDGRDGLQGGAAGSKEDEPPRSPLSDGWSVVMLPASAEGKEVEVDSYADEEVDGVVSACAAAELRPCR